MGCTLDIFTDKISFWVGTGLLNPKSSKIVVLVLRYVFLVYVYLGRRCVHGVALSFFSLKFSSWVRYRAP